MFSMFIHYTLTGAYTQSACRALKLSHYFFIKFGVGEGWIVIFLFLNPVYNGLFITPVPKVL